MQTFVDLLEYLVIAVGGGAVALAGAWWLLGRLIDRRLSRATEIHKAELAQKSEALKTELSIYANEQTVGLSRLDEQRSEAIRELFESLNHWHDVATAIMFQNQQLGPNDFITHYRSKADELKEATDAFMHLAHVKAIFFSQESYAVIVEFATTALRMSREFSRHAHDKVVSYNERDGRTPLLEIEGAIEGLRTEMTSSEEVRDLLLVEFRNLLGASRSTRHPLHDRVKPTS